MPAGCKVLSANWRAVSLDTCVALSAGQLNEAGASGAQQVVEAARQLMGRAGERRVAKKDLALVNT